MWFLTQWALHICCVNAWKYLSNSMSPWWCCHVWNALLHFQKELRQTVFSLPTLARHTAANVLEVLVSLRLRQWLGNSFEAFLWHTVLLTKESDCGKVIGLDNALLLLRCSGLSRHCARGAKGARLWMSAAGPESVFHVAAMIASWLEGFAWSKPTPGFRHLQDMQSSVSVCFQLKFYRSNCWARPFFNKAKLLIRWRPGCLHTELVWRAATQCHFAIHSTRTCQCDSWPSEPCIFAVSTLENIPAIPCPRGDVAMLPLVWLLTTQADMSFNVLSFGWCLFLNYPCNALWVKWTARRLCFIVNQVLSTQQLTNTLAWEPRFALRGLRRSLCKMKLVPVAICCHAPQPKPCLLWIAEKMVHCCQISTQISVVGVEARDIAHGVNGVAMGICEASLLPSTGRFGAWLILAQSETALWVPRWEDPMSSLGKRRDSDMMQCLYIVGLDTQLAIFRTHSFHRLWQVE